MNLQKAIAYNRSRYNREVWQSVQATLCQRGYPVSVDGVPGPETSAAIAALQKAWGYRAKWVDGCCGPTTLLVLDLGSGAFASANLEVEVRRHPLRQYGVDVSVWQGVINWPAVAKAGVGFAIIRTHAGDGKPDKQAGVNLKGVSGTDIAWTGYVPVRPAEHGAKYYTDRLLESCEGCSIPPCIDLEFRRIKGSIDKIGRAQTLAWLHSACQDVRDEHGDVLVYASHRTSKLVRGLAQLGPHTLWEVDYASHTLGGKMSATTYRQWSCVGRVPGIAGNVDVNVRVK